MTVMEGGARIWQQIDNVLGQQRFSSMMARKKCGPKNRTVEREITEKLTEPIEFGNKEYLHS